MAKTNVNDISAIKGVGPKIADKLKLIGITTRQEFMDCDEEVLKSGDFTKKKLEKLLGEKRALKLGDFVTASELMNLYKDMGRISTGVSELDRIMNGGVELGEITGLYGEFASGKTQIAMQVAIMAQRPQKDGGLLEVKPMTKDQPKNPIDVIYIDTEVTCRPERFIQIVNHLGLKESPAFYLDHIHIARADTSEKLHLFIETLETRFADKNVKLIILDSLISLYRAEYVGRGTLAERQGLLTKLLANLQHLADKGVAILFTNQVISKPDMFVPMFVPAGGNVVNHRVHKYVFLRKYSGLKRQAKIIDSSYLPPASCLFAITENGVEDYKDN